METKEPTPHPILDNSGDASAWFKSLGHPKEIAFDLEADGLHRYEDKICLAQVATREAAALLDPLADRATLDPLAQMLADGGVRKILHGGDYDVRLLKKDYGYPIVNLFDTMIASQLLGRKQFGLAALLEAEFAVQTDKKYQRADWSRRPLSPEMIEYAALDVIHLPELCARLEAELEQKGRLGWAREEFELLAKAEPPAPKKPSALDAKGTQKFTPRELAVLQNLLELRDEWAKKWDRPAFKVLSPQLLLAWAEKPPTSRRELIESPGAHRGTLAKLSDEIRDAISRAVAAPPESWPRRPELPRRPAPTEAEKILVKELKEARDAVAAGLELEPGMLVNGATLERIARLDPDAAVAEISTSLKNWQKEVVGEALERVLRAGE
jgi:ribonuclease D